MKTLRVLVVDDEEGFRNLLQWELSSRGLDVVTAANGKEGVELLKNQPFDVVITDITMPQMDGLKLLAEVKRLTPRTEVIVVTGFSAVETAVYAMHQGAFELLLKPYDLDSLMACVKKAADEFSKCQACGHPTHKKESMNNEGPAIR